MENISSDERKLIIEALLFTGSVQVFQEHTDADSKKMVDIAKKLNAGHNVDLNCIYFLVETEYEETYASDIVESFPNVPQVGIKEIMG
jgi:hypothetical protein